MKRPPFILLDNAFVIHHLLTLTDIQLKVYLALKVHANPTGQSWPSVATLALETGFAKRNVRTALRRLEALHLIHATKRYRRLYQQSSNLYTVLSSPVALPTDQHVVDQVVADVDEVVHQVDSPTRTPDPGILPPRIPGSSPPGSWDPGELDSGNKIQRTRSPLSPPLLAKLSDIVADAFGNVRKDEEVARDGKTGADLVPIRRLLAAAGDLGARLVDDPWWLRLCPADITKRKWFFTRLTHKLEYVRGFLDGDFDVPAAQDVIHVLATEVTTEMRREAGWGVRRPPDDDPQPG